MPAREHAGLVALVLFILFPVHGHSMNSSDPFDKAKLYLSQANRKRNAERRG